MAEDKKTPPPQTLPPAEEGKAPEAGSSADKKDKKAGLKFSFSALSPREKWVFNIAAGVLGFLLLDLIVIHPIGNYLQSLDEKIKNEEEVIPRRLMILKYRNKIISEYRSVESLMADSALTQEEEIAKLLRDIERVSKEAGLFVSNINPVKVNKKSESVYELAVDIDGKGELKAIRAFMKKLEKSNSALKIDGFTLKPQGKDSDEIKCQFLISKIGVKKD